MSKRSSRASSSSSSSSKKSKKTKDSKSSVASALEDHYKLVYEYAASGNVDGLLGLPVHDDESSYYHHHHHRNNALHAAVEGKHLPVVEHLITQRHFDVEVEDDHHMRPLHLAAQGGVFPLVELLIKHGASVLADAGDGRTPLVLAAQNDHKEIIRKFLSTWLAPCFDGPPSEEKDKPDVYAWKIARKFQQALPLREFGIMGRAVLYGNMVVLQKVFPPERPALELYISDSLSVSVINNDVAFFRVLLDQATGCMNVYIDHTLPHTFLHYIAIHNRMKMVELIHQISPEILHQQHFGHLAAQYGRSDMIRYMVAKKIITINARSDKYNLSSRDTLLHYALRHNQEQTSLDILDMGADYAFNTPGIDEYASYVTLTIRSPSLRRVCERFWQAYGGKPPSPLTPEYLQLALALDMDEVLEEHKKTINNSSPALKSALVVCAIGSDSPRKMEALHRIIDPAIFHHSAHLNFVPLNEAAMMNSVKAIDEMIEKYNVNINYSTSARVYALSVAATHGRVEALERLLSHGAVVLVDNHRFLGGIGPIQEALRNNHPDTALILIRNGQLHTFADKMGERPIHVAAKKGNAEVVKEILAHDASSLDCENRSGNSTALYIAVMGKSDGVADLLLEKKASISCLGSFIGRSPYTYNTYNEVIDTLLEDCVRRPYYLTQACTLVQGLVRSCVVAFIDCIVSFTKSQADPSVTERVPFFVQSLASFESIIKTLSSSPASSSSSSSSDPYYDSRRLSLISEFEDAFVHHNNNNGKNKRKDASSKLESIWVSKVFADVAFKLDTGELLNAHRAILVAASPIFLAMFTGGFKEAATPSAAEAGGVISVPHVSGPVFSCLLHYCYVGEAVQLDHLTIDQVWELYEEAMSREMQDLVSFCARYLAYELCNPDVNEVYLSLQKAIACKLKHVEFACLDWLLFNLRAFRASVHGNVLDEHHEDADVEVELVDGSGTTPLRLMNRLVARVRAHLTVLVDPPYGVKSKYTHSAAMARFTNYSE